MVNKDIKEKKVAAVVVTYNRKELLREGIEALLAQNYKNLKIFIIDNHSTDGTKQYIADLLKKKNVVYEDTGQNLGGAYGFYFGMKKACQDDIDYIWVMDDDCIVHKDSLTELLKFAQQKNDNFGFLSSKVLWKDGSICHMNIPRKTMFRPLKDLNHDTEITMASFVSLFVKKNTIMEYGLPIKEFFIWTDDWEFTRRISLRQKCYFVTKSVVTHKSTNNFGASIIKEGIDRLDRYQYIYRNDVYLYRREGIKGYCYVYLRNLYNFIFILCFSPNRKLERMRIVAKSTKRGHKFNPPIEYIK